MKVLSGAVWLILFFLHANTVTAAVMLYGTRVIYDAGKREQLVRLSNESDSPLLIQAWLDDGVEKAVAEQKVPFILTPPVFRMSARQGQVLRMQYTGEALPEDRESVFYLNVLEIPPKPKIDNGQNTLQLALRSRVKVFFRPIALAEGPKDLGGKLKWRLVKENGATALEVLNPTGFYASFANASVQAKGKRHSLETNMLGPGETRIFRFTSQVPGKVDMEKVEFNLINDIGANAFSIFTLQDKNKN